eukprot:4100625-Amphidinium_carterae.1
MESQCLIGLLMPQMRELAPGPEQAANAACHPQQLGTVWSRRACQPSSLLRKLLGGIARMNASSATQSQANSIPLVQLPHLFT